MRENERDTHTQRQRDRETERQRDRETERQRDRETERQRDRERIRDSLINDFFSSPEYIKSFVNVARTRLGARCVVFNNRGRGGHTLKTPR